MAKSIRGGNVEAEPFDLLIKFGENHALIRCASRKTGASTLAAIPPISMAEARLAADIATVAFQPNSLARMPIAAIQSRYSMPTNAGTISWAGVRTSAMFVP
jgi:hypothetical protein